MLYNPFSGPNLFFSKQSCSRSYSYLVLYNPSSGSNLFFSKQSYSRSYSYIVLYNPSSGPNLFFSKKNPAPGPILILCYTILLQVLTFSLVKKSCSRSYSYLVLYNPSPKYFSSSRSIINYILPHFNQLSVNPVIFHLSQCPFKVHVNDHLFAVIVVKD